MLKKFSVLFCGLLTHKRFPLVLMGLAVLIMLPALWAGLCTDDIIHRSVLLNSSSLDKPLTNSGTLVSALTNLYAFIPQYKVAPAMEAGYLPWWTYKGMHATFWRPLTSFTLWLDYQLYPDSGMFMHLHNIIWFAVAVFLVARLYRKLIGPIWIAGLAGLLYLLDENYYLPVAMIAHRNSLMALVFGLLAILSYHRWRQDRWRAGAVLTPICVAMSLVSAEAGVATMAYLIAYALFMDNGTRPCRVLRLLPSVLIVIVWRIIYSALGYGVFAGSLYIDPGREPLRFIFAVIERAPILLLGQLGTPPAFLYNYFADTARMIYWLIAMGFLGFTVLILLPILRRDRVAKFWLAGMLLAIVPICSTLPWERNLVFVGIGGMGLIAQFIGVMINSRKTLFVSGIYRFCAWSLLIFFLLVQVGGALAGRFVAPRFYKTFVEQGATLAGAHSLPSDEEQDLIIVRAPVPLFLLMLPAYSDIEDRPLPRSIRALTALVPIEITRTGEKTLKIKSRMGNLLMCGQIKDAMIHPVYFLKDFGSILRHETCPMHTGERIKLPRFSVEVTSVDEDGMPTEAVYEFGVPLNDPSLRWVRLAQNLSYVPFQVPAIGESVIIDAPFSVED